MLWENVKTHTHIYIYIHTYTYILSTYTKHIYIYTKNRYKQGTFHEDGVQGSNSNSGCIVVALIASITILVLIIVFVAMIKIIHTIVYEALKPMTRDGSEYQ